MARTETSPRRYLISIYQSDPEMIKQIVDAVTIPVMAKVRIGHFVEAQVIVTNMSGNIPIEL